MTSSRLTAPELISRARAKPRSRLTASTAVFLMGWSTTQNERKDVVLWLKQRGPSLPVVAVHNAFHTRFAVADV